MRQPTVPGAGSRAAMSRASRRQFPVPAHAVSRASRCLWLSLRVMNGRQSRQPSRSQSVPDAGSHAVSRASGQCPVPVQPSGSRAVTDSESPARAASRRQCPVTVLAAQTNGRPCPLVAQAFSAQGRGTCLWLTGPKTRTCSVTQSAIPPALVGESAASSGNPCQ